MTTTTRPSETTSERLVSVRTDQLVAHTDNIRKSLGDLADLTRSIKTQGVLVPLLVLPADDRGRHVIVAGHRRHQAAVAAGVETLTVIVRDLDPVGVLDAMLIENSQRADLSVGDSIRAVARYQSVAPTDSPTKIARRIGRTPTWVKSRLALAALPGDVLGRLDTGELSIERAAAVAAVVDLGDDAVRDCADHLTGRPWIGDPAAAVTTWRARRDATTSAAEVAAKLDRLGVARFATDADARAAKAVTVDRAGLDLDADQARAHRHEPCHAAVVAVRSWDTQVVVNGYCTNPARHRTTKKRPAVSPIVTPARPATPGPSEADRARRLARGRRRTAATAALAKGRLPRMALLDLAARVAVDTDHAHGVLPRPAH